MQQPSPTRRTARLVDPDEDLLGLAMAPPDHDEGPLVVGTRPVDRTGLSTIAEAAAALGRGEIVIVVDDVDRENEGDFVMAADHATPTAINFMITHGRGLVCLPMEGGRLDALGIGRMVPSDGLQETNFAVSIDIEREGNTGISAHDRSACILRAVASDARPEEFRRPGHVFPLRAVDGGVLQRDGHTEAAVDLARLTGGTPAGVICEIINADGTMARLPELLEVAQEHGLHLITIADLIEHRRRTEPLVHRAAETVVPTRHGDFRTVAYRSDLDGAEHVAFVYGDITGDAPVLARVHSECLTGDVFGSLRCDCGPQLDLAMDRVAAEGRGVVVYLTGHEGRGIGLVEKVRAYGLQDAGADTVEANVELGHAVDLRDFAPGARILADLGVAAVRLMTNNPAKVQAMAAYGIEVATREPLQIAPTEQNTRYLTTKRDKLGHHLLGGTMLETTTHDSQEASR